MTILKKLGLVVPVAALALGASACDNGLTDVNTNPNDPENVPAQTLLSNGILTSIGGSWGSHGAWMTQYVTDIWAQQIAQIKYNDEEFYAPRPEFNQSIWNNFYSGPLMDLADVKAKATEANDANLKVVADVMSQYDFQILTDIFGDIPYSEALKGRPADGGITSPAYDTQKQVYYGMLAALTADVAAINGGSTTSWAAGDALYGGNMTKWRRFANSLRMRMAMRIAIVDPAKACSEFAAAYAAGGFQSNADNAELVWSASQPNQNPLYDYFTNGQRFDNVISATMVDSLAARNDPRLAVYAEPAPTDAEYRGLPNGVLPAEENNILNDYSPIGASFLEAESPSYIMTYAEVLFLEAEAAQRGCIPGGAAAAAAFYQQGIAASWQQYGISTAGLSTYMAQANVAYAGLPSIYFQKWVALYLNGPEAWAEVRRTGYPVLVPVEGNEIAQRLTYPNQEQALNGANYQAAVSRQTEANSLFGNLWWAGGQ